MIMAWIAHLGYGMLSSHAQTGLRISYGAVLCVQLLLTWPNARRFYVSQKYGGYMQRSGLVDSLQTPLAARLLMALWVLCALGIATDTFAIAAAGLNLILARTYFLATRWRSILRGMGAPGHMSYWLAAAVFLLVLTERVDIAGGVLHSLAVIAFRADFAAIMIAAGLYKIAAGYARGEGFEIGLVNPWWGHVPAVGLRAGANWVGFRLLNHAAYITEIACGLAFFVPALAPYAALALGGSFLAIGRMIRLTGLAEMVAVCTLFYSWPGDAIDRALAFLPVAPLGAPATGIVAASLWALAATVAAYILALPLLYVGMTINFYRKRRLPPPLQLALDTCTQTFGLILWRVFTADVINFYVELAIERNGERTTIAVPGPLRSTHFWRFRHVGEFICLASIFTTLKYYPEDSALFRSRLVAYARSLALSDGERAAFTYVAISKHDRAFGFRRVATFVVDPIAGTVDERSLDPSFDVRRPASGSPVSPGTRPGSYAPATS